MKRLITFIMFTCSVMLAHAQATDLVVDCQTPGWLSSKINYGDQQTVKNLKVTGYINATDLEFIGTLIQQRCLNGRLDLYECNIVSKENGGEDNYLDENCFNILKDSYLSYISLPQSIEKSNKIFAGVNATILHIDTLYFNCNTKQISGRMFSGFQYGEMPHHIIVGSNVESIPNSAFEEKTNLESIQLPINIKSIGDRAFYATKIANVNFNELTNLEYLGEGAFAYLNGTKHACNYQPDTLIIHKSLENPFQFSAFAYKDGQHVFIEDNIQTLTGAQYISYHNGRAVNERIILHIDNPVPPTVTNYSNNDNWFKNSTIYVPKGAKQAYLNSGWKYATIIEVNPVEKIELSEHELILNKEQQHSLSVSITPEDADDKSILWMSDDNSIAKVDENGMVTAINSGETKIHVTSTATGIQDVCSIIVRKNVTNVTMDNSHVELNNIGDTKQLAVIITPEDATDKSVTWKSTNESICLVSSTGFVIATGIGTAVVIATTVDGGLMATCVVSVGDGTNRINEINMDEINALDIIFDLSGRKVSHVMKGQVYIINGKKCIVR